MATRKSPSETADTSARVRLKLVGVGGAGGNAVSQIAGTLTGLEVIAVNTDLQALHGLADVEKMQIGSAVTHGLGAGGEVELGLRAAQQDTERLEAAVQNSDLVFLVAGLGGGTGTGAAPVVARVAKGQGALVLGFAILPFTFEGERRRQQALAGLEQLKAQADAVICIANDKLFKVVGENATAAEAFQKGNDLVATGVQAFWQLLSRKGLINVDFADLRAALGSKHSDGIFSFGSATGAEKTRAAVKAVMDNPLLDGGEVLAKAETVLVSVLGGPDMTLVDVQRAVEPISRATPRAHVIMGAAIDEEYVDRLAITVIATANLIQRRPPVSVSTRQTAGSRVAASSPLRTGSLVAVAPVADVKTPAKKESAPKQESLPLEGVSRGRFDKSEPTLVDGEDLDVPTFIRRGVSLKR
ncbi:MAG: Cell division protein FtsZ [Verrucomicrobiae bacterium]|nr:Cell division protein FtsZ [Verrucomicrobiae bacterium]